MTQHMQSYSGQSYDRWVERNTNNSAMGKVQKQFWFTKSAVIRKLGKKEDEHVVASDAELDAKIELFKAIESSTKSLQALLADYQNKICIMAQEENTLGRFLKEYGKQDRSRAGKIMTATGKSLSYTAQQRVALRNPLVRLFQEVDTFHTRAVEDTARTVEEMEKIRTEYRGALMWMKNISQDFNPDQYHQLEKFREVQVTVKQKKAKFDQLKLKSLQKIDLLAASRCNMFSHALILYQNNLITFSEKTAKALFNVAQNYKGYQPYDFQIIKELAEPKDQTEPPTRNPTDGSKEEENEEYDRDDNTFFNAEYHDDPNKRKKSKDPKSKNKTKDSSDPKKSDSLVNLFDTTGERNGEVLLNLENSPDNSPENNDVKTQGVVDLLTDNPEELDTETETQQMLKELFDSPVHKETSQPLPVFGSLDVTAEPNPQNLLEGQIDSNADPFAALHMQSDQQSMFLPSQLLDFGLQGWQQQQQTSTASVSPSASSQIESKFGSTLKASIGNVLSSSGNSRNTATNSSSLKQETNKLDWYKVFQDIDPLADPASALFNQVAEDDKKC
ncbi:unnamed protein product [Meganyctiphanes norvegica]|uniref:AH domain-containing protein n=1 Tax=Meganyctiphanes norvegica TaxID=48144 RepID=A0AAV2RGM5_MEGNR